jgi:hypothetical protein
MMIFSAAAAEALSRLLEPSCQEVPVTCAGHELRAYRLVAVEDVLETGKSSSDSFWTNPESLPTFCTDRLGGKAIFRVPQREQTMVLRPFVEIVRAGNFNGFRFRQIWPRSAMKVWL